MAAACVYPSAFHQRVLALEAPGGAPAALRVVWPSILRPGVPVAARVAVLDRLGYPSLEADVAVELDLPDGGSAAIRFRPGAPAVGRLEGIRVAREGVFRLQARAGGLAAPSNPALCAAEALPGLFWGDPHVHTVLSNCHPDKCRSLNFCYTAARHVSGLDWVAAADHVSNNRCNRAVWKAERTAAELYDDPPAFATLPAYEASLRGGAGGDVNVYLARFPELFVDAYEDGTLRTLCERLQERAPDAFFVVPHHTTRADKHGEIGEAIYPGPARMPLVEIHSKWGTSEYRGNPNPLKTLHPGPSYAADFLARGMRFGFVAGTDSHATLPSGGGVEPGHIDRLPGLTAVRCAAPDRASLFDALRRRHCYAASLERILLHGTVAGCAFGQEAAGARPVPRVELLAAAESDIVRLDVVKNGATIHTETPNHWMARLAYADPGAAAPRLPDGAACYYVRVTCRSGAQAWSSPVWVGA